MNDNTIVIGIMFYDNDFWLVFEEVLLQLDRLIEWNSEEKFYNKSKKEICEIINELSLPIYITYNSLNHNEVFDEKERKRMGDYLKIKENQLYLGKEVYDFINGDSFLNGEFFVLDRRLEGDQKVFIR